MGADVSGLSARRLAWRQATRRRGRALALWLCLVASVALPTLLVLVDSLAGESGLAGTLEQAGGFSVRQDVAGVEALNALDRLVAARAAARTGADLVPLGTLVTIGPLRVRTLRAEQAPADLARLTLTAVFAAHLASHVSVIAGELPPDGLGGGPTAVTMARADADRLGVRLSDRLCGDFGAGGQAQWCVRVVGLWQPLAPGDAFWSGVPTGMALAVGRYDLFQLARLGAPRPPAATVRYRAAAGAAVGAAALAAGAGALAADLRAPQRRVDTRLDRELLAFDGSERRVTAAIHAAALLAAVLGLGAAGVAADRLLDGQRRELALLRARGWTRGRAWLVAFGGPGAVGLTAVGAAVVVCLLAAAALTATGSGLTALALREPDAPGLLLSLGAAGAADAVLLAVLAARAVWRDPRPAPPPAAGRPLLAAVAALAGLAGLVLPHLVDGQNGALLAAPAAGVALLAAAVAVHPAAAGLPGRAGVPGALAHLQLTRRPGQHAGASFVLTLAATAVVFAALGVAAGPAPGSAPLELGLAVGLAAGGAGGLLLALGMHALHFRTAARRRLREYGGLFAHGLPLDQVARSLAGEQAVTAGTSLATGAALGVALALSVLPTPTARAGAAALAAMVALAAGVALVGRLAGRPPAPTTPITRRRTV